MDLFLAASLLLCTVSAVWSAGNVYQLNERDFGAYLQDKDVMLVDFYAPWCPHCKELEPELNAAADAMAAKNAYVFAKVDCTNEGKSLCDRMQVPGYPTVKVFKYGRWVGDYTGGHDRGSILNYVESVTSPTSQQAALTAQPSNVPATLGQAIESRPQPAVASVQAFQPQAPYQSQLSYQSQFPQVQDARPATPYFNGFVNKNPASNASPSLIGSFYKATQKPLYASAKAPEKVPSRSPDSLREKFGSLAALRVFQAKLKMLAAYKNWHRRIRIFQQRVKEYKSQQLGIDDKKLTPPSPQVAAYQGSQQPYNNFAGAPYYHAAPQAAPAQYYQPFNQYRPPAAYASYRSKLKKSRPRKERLLPLATGHQFQVQPQASTVTNPQFQARPQGQRPFKPRFQTQFQALYANKPAGQAARISSRATQQAAQIQRQQQLPQRIVQQGAINSPEGTSQPSENLESLKADLANSLADFAKHEQSKGTSDKVQDLTKPQGLQTPQTQNTDEGKPQGPQTPQTQNTDQDKQVNTNPDKQDLSSLGLDADSAKKIKETAADKIPADVLSKDADTDSITHLSVKKTDDKNAVKSEDETRNKTDDKAKDAEKGKPKEVDEESEMTEDSSSGDIPEKKDQVPKSS